jgi:hypothetical protein
LKYINSSKTSFEINYFTNNYQNGALSFIHVFLFLLFLCLPRYPADQWLLMRRLKNYRFLIGVLIFLVSSNKSNDLLIFTLPSSYHGNKSYRNTSDKIETGGFDCSNSRPVFAFLAIII